MPEKKPTTAKPRKTTSTSARKSTPSKSANAGKKATASGKAAASSSKKAPTKRKTSVPAGKATATRKTSAPAKRKPTADVKDKAKAPRSSAKLIGVSNMKPWQRGLLAGLMVIAFGAGFYVLCIRPYSYRWKPCYGFEGYGVCLPSGYTVHGLDLSHYQGDVDWTALATHRANRFPLRFVFIKATEGATHTDPRFNENFEAARQNGFIRGAYHYFIPQTDAAEQARHFINTVKLEDGDLPPVLDVEITGKRPTEELQEAVKVWMNIIEAHYGVKPILYTSYKFKRRHLDTPDINQYPYWIAHYYVNAVRYRGSWAFWQHTDVGRVEGIDGKVDLNVFNGTMQQLLGMTVSSEPTPADNEE